jgi:hypothetical protein
VERITARSVHIVDEKGHPRGAFGETDERVVMGLLDTTGAERLALILDTDETAGLMIKDRNAIGRLGLVFKPDEVNGLALKDENGKIRLELGHVQKEQTGLQIYESDLKNPSVELLSLGNGSRSLSFFNPDKKPILALGVDPKGGNFLSVNDENGNVRAGIIHSKNGTNILVVDENEKIIWEVPKIK